MYIYPLNYCTLRLRSIGRKKDVNPSNISPAPHQDFIPMCNFCISLLVSTCICSCSLLILYWQYLFFKKDTSCFEITVSQSISIFNPIFFFIGRYWRCVCSRSRICKTQDILTRVYWKIFLKIPGRGLEYLMISLSGQN